MVLWVTRTHGNSNDSFHKDGNGPRCWRIFIRVFYLCYTSHATGKQSETHICYLDDSSVMYYYYYSSRSFSVLILQMNQKKRELARTSLDNSSAVQNKLFWQKYGCTTPVCWWSTTNDAFFLFVENSASRLCMWGLIKVDLPHKQVDYKLCKYSSCSLRKWTPKGKSCYPISLMWQHGS